MQPTAEAQSLNPMSFWGMEHMPSLGEEIALACNEHAKQIKSEAADPATQLNRIAALKLLGRIAKDPELVMELRAVSGVAKRVFASRKPSAQLLEAASTAWKEAVALCGAESPKTVMKADFDERHKIAQYDRDIAMGHSAGIGVASGAAVGVASMLGVPCLAPFSMLQILAAALTVFTGHYVQQEVALRRTVRSKEKNFSQAFLDPLFKEIYQQVDVRMQEQAIIASEVRQQVLDLRQELMAKAGSSGRLPLQDQKALLGAEIAKRVWENSTLGPVAMMGAMRQRRQPVSSASWSQYLVANDVPSESVFHQVVIDAMKWAAPYCEGTHMRTELNDYHAGVRRRHLLRAALGGAVAATAAGGKIYGTGTQATDYAIAACGLLAVGYAYPQIRANQSNHEAWDKLKKQDISTALQAIGEAAFVITQEKGGRLR